jgi:hypothetical protein
MKHMLTIFIILMILKLADVIDWSWWWVTCPLWIPIVGVIALCFLVFWFLLLFDNPTI